jgi:hypothetical protein
MDYGGHCVVEACFVVAGEKSSPCRSEVWYASMVVVVDDEVNPGVPVVDEVVVAWAVEEWCGVLIYCC